MYEFKLSLLKSVPRRISLNNCVLIFYLSFTVHDTNFYVFRLLPLIAQLIRVFVPSRPRAQTKNRDWTGQRVILRPVS